MLDELAGVVALNPGWALMWEPDGRVNGECVCRLQNAGTREEVNGNGPTREDAAEMLLVRMELSGRFDMGD